MSYDQKAREILSQVLAIPPEKIDDTVKIGGVKQWDSIAHMNLVLSIEEEVGRKLHPSEFLEIDSFVSLTRFFEQEE